MNKLILILLLLITASAGYSSELNDNEKITVVKITSTGDGLLRIESKENAVQLFVFDMNGSLLLQSGLEMGKKNLNVNLKKGIYFYNVLKRDKLLESGAITIK